MSLTFDRRWLIGVSIVVFSVVWYWLPRISNGSTEAARHASGVEDLAQSKTVQHEDVQSAAIQGKAPGETIGTAERSQDWREISRMSPAEQQREGMRRIFELSKNPGSLVDPSLAPVVEQFQRELPARQLRPKELTFVGDGTSRMPSGFVDFPFWKARTEAEASWMDAQAFPRDFNVLSWDRFAVEKAAKAGNRTAMNMLMHIRLEQGDPKWDRENHLVRNPSAYNARLRAVVALGFLAPGDFALRQRGGWRTAKPVNMVEALAWSEIAERFGDSSVMYMASTNADLFPVSIRDIAAANFFVMRSLMRPVFDRFIQPYARERAALRKP